MTGSKQQNPFVALSDAMADAVAQAGAATVLVNARRRMPASGVLYAADLVLTADHVVEREEDIQVVLADGRQLATQLAGRDPINDLALLRLAEPASQAAQPAAQEARVGQLVLALGRPSLEGIEASLGVVSAVGGPVRFRRGGLLERYLRTDTIPYPGFSGGPLIDGSASVLGINTSGLTPGAALTIPVQIAWEAAAAMAAHGRVRRGYLGIRTQMVELTEQAQQTLGRKQSSGLLLVGVDKESPAAGGGLMIGDVIVALEGRQLLEPDDLVIRLHNSPVDAKVDLEILRGGQPMKLTVTLGERRNS